MKLERELMRGAAPTAVMQVLAGGEKYGYELVESLARQANGLLGVGQSTLYPLLYNLEAKGLVTSRVDETGPRPRRADKSGPGRGRLYRPTKPGGGKWAEEPKRGQALGEGFGSGGLRGNPTAGAAGGGR